MFGKLMKYELRYLIRIFAPMWAAVMALCILSRLTVQPRSFVNAEEIEMFLPIVVMMVTVLAIVTVMVVSTVVLLLRFYKGMYGDEGYLMFTLPVTTGSLIHSKGLSAMLMLIATELVTFLGIMVMVSYPQLWVDSSGLGYSFSELWDYFVEYLGYNGLGMMEFVLLVFWGLLAFLIVTAEGIYMIYLAISLGQLWKKHPVAGAVVAYYGLNIVINGAESLIGYFVGGDIMNMNMTFAAVDYSQALVMTLLYATIRGLLLIAASFFGTKLILDKKLNIQ